MSLEKVLNGNLLDEKGQRGEVDDIVIKLD